MKKTIYYPLILIVGALVLSSCVTTETARMTNKTFPKVHPENVIVFMSEEDIEGEFVRIALIYSEGSTTWTDRADLIKKSKETAAEMGANAIVLGGIEEPSTGAKIAGAVLGTGSDRQGQVVAIRLLDSN